MNSATVSLIFLDRVIQYNIRFNKNKRQTPLFFEGFLDTPRTALLLRNEGWNLRPSFKGIYQNCYFK